MRIETLFICLWLHITSSQHFWSGYVEKNLKIGEKTCITRVFTEFERWGGAELWHQHSPLWRYRVQATVPHSPSQPPANHCEGSHDPFQLLPFLCFRTKKNFLCFLRKFMSCKCYDFIRRESYLVGLSEK